ncbi:MAG TPA: cbb3-type cytochrome c oxidase N-terminal domain-containing protein [Saprospiraceae bacterium]|nr:cbb3-type cytochrome c oxidase N-terminal domain-containing protein [Saprospiraceae bacterium]
MKTFKSTATIISRVLAALIFPAAAMAQTAAAPASKMTFPLDADTALFAIALTLAVVIIALSGVLRSAIKMHFQSKKLGDGMKAIVTGLIVILGFDQLSAQAADTAVAAKPAVKFLLSTQGWFMLILIVIEIYTLVLMRRWIRFYTGIEAYDVKIVKQRRSLWDRLNAFRPLEAEGDIDTGHEYDGIRELDNITPPWFTIAFIGTIIFGAFYLYRYHIAESAPLQVQEFQLAMKKAEQEQLEYLSTQANQIDESSVTLLPEGQYEEGKTIFKAACAVCHGPEGQGLVGPNMTDDYWIHGGSVKEIFTVIKYGVIDKGMKSWKDDYSPSQIAQLTSYIKSLRGTNPPNQKEPQGVIYKEEAAAPAMDSAKIK